MFVLSDNNQNEQREFPDRDVLIEYLETANSKAKALRETIYILRHISPEGEVLERVTLTFPLINQTVDDALEKFGFKKAPKAKKKETIESIQPDQTPERVETAVQPPRKLSFFQKQGKFFLVLGVMLPLLGLGYLGFLQVQSQAKIKQLETQLKQVQVLPNLQNQIDVFSRHFLPSYYSGDKELVRPFVSEDLFDQLNLVTGSLQSVILESVSPQKSDYQVTYVLSIKDPEENRRTIRLTYTITEDKDSRYGFLVKQLPESLSFP